MTKTSSDYQTQIWYAIFVKYAKLLKFILHVVLTNNSDAEKIKNLPEQNFKGEINNKQ